MGTIYLRSPLMDKKYCLCFESDDHDEVKNFKVACLMQINPSFQVFHQSDCREFQMFEFWSGTSEEILTECEKVSGELGMVLQIK